ncbi:MAG TPA: YdeI/OmpD-associated family protein, partial [Candidatus Limnocylindrales bacterium]|nr:YdeI/OmpD-associated family protein [Candidatus Limnocylindrales bacterium]
MPVERPTDAIFFETAEQLRDWFDANHATATELWLGSYKKSTGKPSVSWSDAVDEALCVGWIDSVRYSLDADRAAQRFTPRRKGSNWSAINVAKIAELREAGRLRSAGEAAFAQRREDRTAVYSFERLEDAELTAEEEARFRANEAAWTWFSARPPSFRKQALHWVVAVKRP